MGTKRLELSPAGQRDIIFIEYFDSKFPLDYKFYKEELQIYKNAIRV
jgi:hypothetical protein